MKNTLLKIVFLVYFWFNLYGDPSLTPTIIVTNNITAIEGFPLILQSNLSGNYFHWYKEGQTLMVSTNNFFRLESAVEGDVGRYVVQQGKNLTIFNVSFKRTIRLYVDGQEIEKFYNSDGQIVVSESSKIRLVPFIEGLPIRYTLDGSEPNERSKLYVEPITIYKSTYIRAKIEIPETDSTRIKVSHDTF